MNEKNIYEIVRERVVSNLIEKVGSSPGDDLTTKKLNIMEIKGVLYKTLMDIEIEEVKDRWS